MADELGPNPSLLDVAAAVADRTRLDWVGLASAAKDPAERAAFQRLRLVAAFASAAENEAPIASPPLQPPFDWGPVRALEHIARGSFGDVYRAVEVRLDREVALKLLRRYPDSHGETESAVIDEARHMARVRHPNIVTIYGAERIDDRVGLWMEFVHGVTLEDELRRTGPLRPADLLVVAAALSSAIEAVHAAGLLHRDVKAQNVMRDRDGRILLTDFGTGQDLDLGGAETGELAGTPLYLAPEVLAGAPASPVSDIYSLGVLLFHLATGSFPVTGTSIRAIRDAHAARQPSPVRSLRSDLPAPLATLIDRAIDPDPRRRHQTARELREAVGHIGKARSWPKLAAAVAIAAIGVSALWQATQTPPAAQGTRQMFADATLLATDISPDGNWIVGADYPDASGIARLVMRHVATGRERTLAGGEHGMSTVAPVFSHDGRHVAFRFVAQDGSGVPDRRPSAIGVVATAGGGRPRLLYNLREQYAVPIGWSPDGRRVLVQSSEDDSTEQGRLRAQTLSWLDVSDGRSVSLRTFERWQQVDEIRLSPDGRRIAFAATVSESSYERRLFLIDAESGADLGAVALAGVSSDPVWTRDGSRLLFVSDRSGLRALWSATVDPQGQARTPVPVRSTFSGKPLGTTTDGRFLFSQESGGEPLEFLIAREPSGPRVVETFIGEKGQFSPSGQLIAFVRRINRREVDLIVRTVADQSERVYQHRGIALGPPRWIDEERLRVMVTARGDNWTPGGGFYSVDLHTHVFTREGDRGDRSEFLGGRRWSPDGRQSARVVVNDATREGLLRIADGDGDNVGSWRDLWGPFPAEFGGGGALRWMPDGRNILVVSTEETGFVRVWRVPVDGIAPTAEGVDLDLLSDAAGGARLSPRLGVTIDISPDGMYLLAAVSTLASSEVWSIDGLALPTEGRPQAGQR